MGLPSLCITTKCEWQPRAGLDPAIPLWTSWEHYETAFVSVWVNDKPAPVLETLQLGF
jgi:hypothetical protein